MKKTNKTGKIWLIIFLVAAVATAIISILEHAFGADKVFMGAILLLPVVFVWCLFTSQAQADRLFNEREKAWRNNCDLHHRKVIKKTQ